MKQISKDLPSNLIFPWTDAHEAYTQLRRTHDAIHHHVSRKLMKWGLSVPKYGILVRLYDQNELSISYLSSQIFRSNSNMTTLIDRMEKDGLVRRVNGDEDRRHKMIHLTPKGHHLARVVIKEYRPFQQQIMGCLSAVENQVLRGMLKKIRKNI